MTEPAALPTRVALLKLALVRIHELCSEQDGKPLVERQPIDGGRIQALIEETFEKLDRCADQ